jgi:hypothetical protein
MKPNFAVFTLIHNKDRSNVDLIGVFSRTLPRHMLPFGSWLRWKADSAVASRDVKSLRKLLMELRDCGHNTLTYNEAMPCGCRILNEPGCIGLEFQPDCRLFRGTSGFALFADSYHINIYTRPLTSTFRFIALSRMRSRFAQYKVC